MSLLAMLFDEYAALDPGPGYWINNDDTRVPEGDYCRSCALEKNETIAGDLCTYGSASEQDGCLHCHKCGKLLSYVLTDHGANAELDHFKTKTFRKNKHLDRETAFHLARLIEAKPNDLNVVRIAARAIRCMRRIPRGRA